MTGTARVPEKGRPLREKDEWVRRWLVLTLAIAIAAAAGYALLSGTDPGSSGTDSEIDHESRSALREILRDADQGEATP